MWLSLCSKAGLHIPIEMSPSLKLTLLPPKALILDDVGRLINEKTDRPALLTWAETHKANMLATIASAYLRIKLFSISGCKDTTFF